MASLGLLYILLFVNIKEGLDQVLSLLGMILFFGGAGIYTLLSFFRVKGEYNDEVLTYQNPFGKNYTIVFDEIESVTYNNDFSWYVIHYKGQKIRLDYSLRGLDALLEILLAKIYEDEV